MQVSPLPWSLPIPAVEVEPILQSVGGFVVGFALVFLTGRYAFKPALNWLLKDRKLIVEPAVRQLFMEALDVVIFLSAFWTGLQFAGFGSLISETATLVSAGTLALGVASRDIVENLINGVFLITNPQFEVGDWVEWNDDMGIIEEVGVRETKIRTFDNRLVIVPNTELASNAVTNHGDKDRIKLTLPVGVGYSEDLDVVKKLIVDEALSIESVIENPMPSVFVEELSASWVSLKVAIWVTETDHATAVETRDELASRIKRRFGEENVKMPFKSRRLSGQIQVANIDSDKLDPAEGTTVENPSQIDLDADLSAGEEPTGTKSNTGPIEEATSEVTEVVEDAVDFTDESDQKDQSGSEKQDAGRGNESDLIVGDDENRTSEKGNGDSQDGDSQNDDGQNGDSQNGDSQNGDSQNGDSQNDDGLLEGDLFEDQNGDEQKQDDSEAKQDEKQSSKSSQSDPPDKPDPDEDEGDLKGEGDSDSDN